MLQLDKDIDILDQEERRLDKIWFQRLKDNPDEFKDDIQGSWDAYQEFLAPLRKKASPLYRRQRYIMPYTLDVPPDYGDKMSLEDFKKYCEFGGFIDYDGFGHYMKDGFETSITIYPSDFKKGNIRKEFKEIIWYNR